jgi:PAS domain S-box-containing protein
MPPAAPTYASLERDLATARAERDDAREALRAILNGEADAVVVPGPNGQQVFSRHGVEEPYRVLVEAMTDGAALLIAGNIAYCNSRFAHIVGTSPGQIVGSAFNSLVTPARRPALELFLANATTSPSTAEMTCVAADGRDVPTRMSARAMDLAGTPAICLVVSDISALLRSEETRRVGVYSRGLIEASPDPLILVDFQGNVTDVNQATEKMTGLARAELVGRKSPVPDGVAQGAEFEMPHRDGRATTVLYNVSEYHDTSGSAAGVLISLRDITERTRALEALRLSQEMFRDLIETTSDWIWEVDAEARITYCNPRVTEIIGYEPAEVLGKRASALVVPEERAAVEDFVRKRLVRPQSVSRLEVTLAARDGRRPVVEVEALPLFDPRGTFSGYRGIARDITVRKQLEALRQTREMELTDAQRIGRMGSFVWTIATGAVQRSEGLSILLGRDHHAPAPAFETLSPFFTPES